MPASPFKILEDLKKQYERVLESLKNPGEEKARLEKLAEKLKESIDALEKDIKRSRERELYD